MINTNWVSVSDHGAVGDGVTDDFAALQAAFYAAGGGKLVFDAGKVYSVSAAIVIPSDTHVDFAGSTVRRNYNNSPSGRTLFGVSNTHGVTLSNGVLDGNGDQFPADPDGFNIVTGVNVSDLRVRDCVFKDVVGNHAIDIANSQGIWVKGCRFEGYKNVPSGLRNFSEAIQIDPDVSAGGSPSLDWIIEGNVFTGSSTPGFSPWPSGVGNHATHATQTAGTNRITIRGNHFVGCTFAAVRLFWWLDTVIEGNSFWSCFTAVRSDPSSSGFLRSANSIISGNTIRGASGPNINMVACDGLIVSNNSIVGGTTGIEMQYAANVAIVGNSIRSCTLNGIYIFESSFPAENGVGHTRNICIQGNNFRSIGFRGIHVSCAGKDLVFVGNSLVGMSTAANTRACIRVDGGWAGAIFDGNLTADGGAANKPTYGLEFASTSSGITIGTNRLFGAAGAISNLST